MHCHMLTHEDIGMMQRLSIVSQEASGAKPPGSHRSAGHSKSHH